MGPRETARSGRLSASVEDQERHTAFVLRNVSVRGRRTSIRLEPQIWDILVEICRRESCTLHDVLSYADEHRLPRGSLASSLRILILDYFRSSATEEGHKRAGHGQGMFLVQQKENRERRATRAYTPEPPDELKHGP